MKKKKKSNVPAVRGTKSVSNRKRSRAPEAQKPASGVGEGNWVRKKIDHRANRIDAIHRENRWAHHKMLNGRCRRNGAVD